MIQAMQMEVQSLHRLMPSMRANFAGLKERPDIARLNDGQTKLIDPLPWHPAMQACVFDGQLYGVVCVATPCRPSRWQSAFKIVIVKP